MRTRTALAGVAVAAVCLALVDTVQAQINSIAEPFLRVEKRTGPTLPPPTTGSTSVPYDRLMEIVVELAWLADPATCQCPLEAKVKGATLLVQGKLADQAGRDAALRIAHLNCPMKVIDELKIGSRPDKAASVDAAVLLQTAAVALREAFPSCYQNYRLQTAGEGKIIVNGPVQGFEEKLAVSRALRRVRGCSCVVNQLALPGQSSPGHSTPVAASPPKMEVSKGNPPSVNVITPNNTADRPLVRIRPRSRSRFRALLCLPSNGRQTQTGPVVAVKTDLKSPNIAPPLPPAAVPTIQRVAYTEPARHAAPPLRQNAPTLEFKAASMLDPAPTGQAYETRGIVVLPDGDPVAITAHQLKERIAQFSGQQGKNVYVCFTAPKEVQIQIRARSLAEAAQMSQAIMQIPDLSSYRVDIRVQLAREANRR